MVMKSLGIPNLDNAMYIDSSIMLSKAFDQSNAKATNLPSFFERALSMKRLAMNSPGLWPKGVWDPQLRCWYFDTYSHDYKGLPGGVWPRTLSPQS